MEAEQWKPIVGWEGLYEVSSLGQVRGVSRSLPMRDGRTYTKEPKVLAPQWGGRGYAAVKLRRPGVEKRVVIHREVLKAFVGPCPPGMEACHNNDVRQDNRLTNLRWDTSTANHLDAVANGKHWQTGKTKCPQGHEYNEENTVIYRRHRRCRTCQNGPRPSRPLLDGES